MIDKQTIHNEIIEDAQIVLYKNKVTKSRYDLSRVIPTYFAGYRIVISREVETPILVHSDYDNSILICNNDYIKLLKEKFNLLENEKAIENNKEGK